MKKLSLLAIVLGTFTISQAAFAGAYLEEDDYVKLCEAVKSDNKLRLKREMKFHRLDFKDLSEGLVCDGMNIMEFAQASGADDMATLIAKRTNLGDDTLLTRRVVD